MKSFIIDRSGENPVLKPTNDRKIPVYDTLADAEADLSNLEGNQIIATHDFGRSNCPFPVNSTYPQFPGCPEPSVLWVGTTWTKLDFGGAFFRASGGNAQAFDNQSTPQSESLPNIKGTFYAGISNQGWVNLQGASGAFKAGNPTSYWNAGGTYWSGGTGTSNSMSIDASRSNAIYGTKHNDNEEVAPLNYTFQIWKRIA